MSSSPSFLDPIILSLIKEEEILDIGCGLGHWGFLLQTNYWECGFAHPPICDGADASENNVKFCHDLGVYREVSCQVFPVKIPYEKYKTIVASEVIEHMSYDQAMLFLDTLEESGAKRIIITTPNFEELHPGLHTCLGFNKYEAHESYIPRKVFRQRGYKIQGAGMSSHAGFAAKILKGGMYLVKQHKSPLLSGIGYHFPFMAHTTIAYKDF
jgi:hypothetical protein